MVLHVVSKQSQSKSWEQQGVATPKCYIYSTIYEKMKISEQKANSM